MSKAVIRALEKELNLLGAKERSLKAKMNYNPMERTGEDIGRFNESRDPREKLLLATRIDRAIKAAQRHKWTKEDEARLIQTQLDIDDLSTALYCERGKEAKK